jgi:prepilin-type N-terminal cleavage/methylation domain-containing protein
MPGPSIRGFSLIELAVAIFVVALLLGGILIPLATQVEQRLVKHKENWRKFETRSWALLLLTVICLVRTPTMMATKTPIQRPGNAPQPPALPLATYLGTASDWR